MIETHNGDSGYQPEIVSTVQPINTGAFSTFSLRNFLTIHIHLCFFGQELTVGRHTDHANFPGHETTPGHRKSAGHGVPEQLSPGHGLTTRIAQLRREVRV